MHKASSNHRGPYSIINRIAMICLLYYNTCCLQQTHVRSKDEHTKKCSSSLVMTEMQIKTTLRYYLRPVRIVLTKKSGNNRCWRECGETGMIFYCWWEIKLVQPLWRTVWRFLKDLEIEIPFDPAILLLGI